MAAGLARQPVKPPQPGQDSHAAPRPGGLRVSLLNPRPTQVCLADLVQVPEQSDIVLPDGREPGYKVLVGHAGGQERLVISVKDVTLDEG